MVKKKKLKKRNWRKYLFEFLSIFVAVISAFALNNWNDNRKNDEAQSKILIEILNGLEKDVADAIDNMRGHQLGIEACKLWRKVINDEKRKLDSSDYYFSLGVTYLALTKDFTSIQNTSGYEALKSRGFELIKNDKLRARIVSLYEFDYQQLRKVEEEYNELQFYKNYFNRINDAIAPNFIFDSEGIISSLNLPVKLTDSERKILLSYLWIIQGNRDSLIKNYEKVIAKINKLKEEVELELRHSPHTFI